MVSDGTIPNTGDGARASHHKKTFKPQQDQRRQFFLPRAQEEDGGTLVAVPHDMSKLRDPVEMLRHLPVEEEGELHDTGLTLHDIIDIHSKHHAIILDGDDLHGLWQMIVSDIRFEVVSAIFVLVSIVSTATEVDATDSNSSIFVVFNITFAIVFAFELFVRVAANRGLPMDSLLYFDAALVFVAGIEVLALQSDSVDVDLSFCQGLRLFRLFRIVRLVRLLKSLTVMSVLCDALCHSLRPLFFAVLLVFILVFGSALVMTSLVPLVNTEREINAQTLSYCGTLATSMLTMLEAMTGMLEWGPNVVAPLVGSGYEDGTFWSIIFVVSLQCFVTALRLGICGLISGLFLDQLFAAQSRNDESEWQEQVADHHGVITGLGEVFVAMGLGPGEPVTWEELKKGLEDNDDVQRQLCLTVDAAHHLFNHLDRDGTDMVSMEALIFGLFKLRSTTKSIEMLSIDFQQEKALRRIAQVKSSLHKYVAATEARLSQMLSTTEQLRDRLNRLRKEFLDLKDLEAKLLESEAAYRQEARRDEEDPVGTLHISGEQLKLDTELQKRFNMLEVAVASLFATGSSSERLPVEAVANGVVHSARESLKWELQLEVLADDDD